MAAGQRVLQVGLDPQSSLEVLAGLGFDTPPERTVSRLLLPEEFPDGEPLEAVVHATPWAAELVPASKALATAERALGEPGRGGASQRLRRGLERLGVDERWDVVLIDCPPGMTPLTMNALVAADARAGPDAAGLPLESAGRRWRRFVPGHADTDRVHRRSTAMPDDETLATTVAALEARGFSTEVGVDLNAAREAVLARILDGPGSRPTPRGLRAWELHR